MSTTAWISSAAVAVLAAGGFAYYNSTCDTCIISSILGTAETTTVAADAPAEPSSCCALSGSKADAVLASQETTDTEACEEACEGCEEGCEEGCDETEEVANEQLATGDAAEAGNG